MGTVMVGNIDEIHRELPTERGSIVAWYVTGARGGAVGCAVLEEMGANDIEEMVWFVAGSGRQYLPSDIPSNWVLMGRLEIPE